MAIAITFAVVFVAVHQSDRSLCAVSNQGKIEDYVSIVQTITKLDNLGQQMHTAFCHASVQVAAQFASTAIISPPPDDRLLCPASALRPQPVLLCQHCGDQWATDLAAQARW